MSMSKQLVALDRYDLGAHFSGTLTCYCDTERGLKRPGLQQLPLQTQLEVRNVSHAASQEHVLQQTA